MRSGIHWNKEDATVGERCTHRDVKPVMTIGKCELWGGRETQVMPRADEFECIISLLGSYSKPQSKFTISRGARRMFGKLAAYQQRRNNVLCIDWPDMQAPKLDYGFWEALAEDLGKVAGRAAIFCMGGHGRTGTALSALIAVTKYAPALESGDIIQWLRENYCREAVETASQIDYLRRVLKVQTKLEGGKSWATPHGFDRGQGSLSHYFKNRNQEFDDEYGDSNRD